MNRVLIVDDQLSFRCHLVQLLTLGGLVVVGEAPDIPSAETLVRITQPDLAVVDIMLPGINGLEGTRILKRILPGLRVYLVSAFTDQASLFTASAREVGAESFLAKDEIDLKTVQAWKE